jgi:hypothetical protein
LVGIAAPHRDSVCRELLLFFAPRASAIGRSGRPATEPGARFLFGSRGHAQDDEHEEEGEDDLEEERLAGSSPGLRPAKTRGRGEQESDGAAVQDCPRNLVSVLDADSGGTPFPLKEDPL